MRDVGKEHMKGYVCMFVCINSFKNRIREHRDFGKEHSLILLRQNIASTNRSEEKKSF